MLYNIDLRNILVIDIETVSQHSAFEQLDDTWQKLWSKKMKHYIKDDITVSSIYDRAGIYAEFGKIICISAGCFIQNNGAYNFRIKSFFGDNEKEVLTGFSEMLSKNYNTENHYIAAHNGKEFDYPYIARRCLINGISIPAILNNSGKKPWEIRLLDTMDMWKFGDYKNFTSLNLLAAVFGINSPKDDIDGSKVGSVYWKDNNIERIRIYCEKDIVTVAQLLLKFKGMEMLKEDDVVYTN